MHDSTLRGAFHTDDQALAERESLAGDFHNGWHGAAPLAELTDVEEQVTSLHPSRHPRLSTSSTDGSDAGGRVAEELVEVAEHLTARGLGEGYDFWIRGRPVPGGRSSEFIGLEKTDDAGYRVWYLGDWGTERTLVETEDWGVARSVFVEEAVTLARGRHRKRKILDDPDDRRRWWQRR